MRKNFVIYYLYLTTVLLFVACGQTETEINLNKGFFEYQYDYQTTDENGAVVTKQAFERISINRAAFMVNNEAVLPDTLKSRNFRQVDLYVFSDDYSGLNTASLAGSYVKIQLWDTLSVDGGKLLSYSYMNRTLTGLLSYIEPACMEFTANMKLQRDETTEAFSFKYQIAGELGKRVYLFDLNNNQYQLLASGLFNSKLYNLHYVGEIKEVINITELLAD